MVLFTPKKLTFKRSRKQHQILAQTAYYQAGKIVVQTILPEQPPVALITLNTLGTTCSTSADTYIPIENIFNTQSCSFLESRLVSLYGGKAASLLIEYQQQRHCTTFSLQDNLPANARADAYPLGLPSNAALVPTGASIAELRSPLWASGNPPTVARVDPGFVARVNHDPSASYSFTPSFASEVSTTSPQPISDSSSRFTSHTHSKSKICTCCKRKSSALDFVRVKASIRCKAKKGCALYTSEQNASRGLSATDPEGIKAHALQYLPLRGLQHRSVGSDKQLSYARLKKVRIPAVPLWGTASAASEICTKSRRIPLGSPLQRILAVPQRGTAGVREKGNASTATICNSWQNKEGFVQLKGQKLTKQKTGEELAHFTSYPVRVKGLNSNCVNESKAGSEASAYNTETKLINDVTERRTCFAGAGNNIFQSTLGNREIQTATHLARIMVNYWNFYSLNKSSFYSVFKKDALVHQLNALHSKASSNSINKLTNFPLRGLPPTRILNQRFVPVARENSHAVTRVDPPASTRVNSSAAVKVNPRPFASVNLFANIRVNHYLPQYLPLRGLQPQSVLAVPQRGTAGVREKGNASTATICKRWQSKEKIVQLKGSVLLEQRAHLLQQHEESVAKKLEVERYAKRKYNVRVWGIKLKVKDKTPQGNIIYRVRKRRNNLYFAIAQSKNSLRICESSGASNSSYNIQRLSIENIGNYSQLNNNNFQLINSLQFSNLQRDRFYPNWFRLYLPDMEATEFLKNVANYYFSLGLQTLTFPSTKFSYYSDVYLTPDKLKICKGVSAAHTLRPIQISDLPGVTEGKGFPFNVDPSGFPSNAALVQPVVQSKERACVAALPRFAFGKLGISIASPFLTFLNKNTQKEKFISTLQAPGVMGVDYIKDPSFTKVEGVSPTQIPYKSSHKSTSRHIPPRGSATCKEYNVPPSGSSVTPLGYPGGKRNSYSLNVPFSLLLENQIFPLNDNGFSIVEKELLYNALVNSSFAKAFYLISQNRQLLDFLADYLLRFQILRQHQILYLFSTLLLGCTKTA